MIQFTRPDTWHSSSHDAFLEALEQGDPDMVQQSCRELMVQAIKFLYKIYVQELREEHESRSYIQRFISGIYSLPDKMTVDVDGLVNGLRLYVHHCRHAADYCESTEECVCHSLGSFDTNIELGIAISVLVKLADILQYQAMSLTVKRFRHMREFLNSVLNCSIKRGIGFDILACSEHIHRQSQDKELYLDHVPCNLLFYHIASTFGIKVTKIKLVRDFDHAHRISLAVSSVKC